MKHIITVFRKELTDTLRDRRTLLTMLAAPLILYPLMMLVFTKFTSAQAEKSMEKVLAVAVFQKGGAERLVADLKQDDKLELVEVPTHLVSAIDAGNQQDIDSLAAAAIRDGSIDIILIFSPTFATRIDQYQPGDVMFYYNATSQDITKERIKQKLALFEQLILNERFAANQLDRSFAKGLAIEEKNVATRQEILGELVGGILPYIFVLLCFTGSMYPAIDLAAGEKERGTIETILTSPVSKLHLVLGKIGVIMLTGLTSAVVAIASILLSVQLIDGIPIALDDILSTLMHPSIIALLIAMLIPVSLLFASILISLSIYARSYKEAQSLITPLLIVIIFPAFIALMPGVELTITTALIPILNLSLVTKQLLAGTLSLPLFLLALGSQFVLAGIGTWFSIRWFGRESVLLR